MEKKRFLIKILKRESINKGYTLIEVMVAITIFVSFTFINIHILNKFLKEFNKDNSKYKSMALMDATLNYIDALVDKGYYVGYDGNYILVKFKEYSKDNKDLIILKEYRIGLKPTNTLNVYYKVSNYNAGENVICRNIKFFSASIKGGCLYVKITDENNNSAKKCFILKNMELP